MQQQQQLPNQHLGLLLDEAQKLPETCFFESDLPREFESQEHFFELDLPQEFESQECLFESDLPQEFESQELFMSSMDQPPAWDWCMEAAQSMDPVMADEAG